MPEKILSLTDLAEHTAALRAAGKRVVLCHGVFDLIHPGHIKHLEAARREGDVLVVTVTADRFVSKGPGRPVFNQRLRAETLAALQAVDLVAVVDDPAAIPAIDAVRPEIYVKGMDYANPEDDLSGQIVAERRAVEGYGGRVVFTDEEVFSSTALLNRHFEILPPETRSYLQDLRKDFALEQVLGAFDKVANRRVLVVGDAILDEYIYCEPMGKSSKEYLVSTRYREREQFAGGIHAVANHLAGICSEVTLLTVTGEDEAGDFLDRNLNGNVRRRVLRSGTLPTTLKSRYVDRSFLQKLFQVCTIEDGGLPDPEQREFESALQEEVSRHDLVVVADFGHGLFSPKTRRYVAKHAPFLALNAQTNSANTGFNLVTGYPRADYVSIDEPEARLAAHDRTGDLMSVAEELLRAVSCGMLSITRGHRGSLVLAQDQAPVLTPALSSEVVDRIGAGDAYLAITSPFAAAGLPPALVGFIGNVAGALAVRIVGNRDVVSPLAMKKFITTLLHD